MKPHGFPQSRPSRFFAWPCWPRPRLATTTATTGTSRTSATCKSCDELMAQIRAAHSADTGYQLQDGQVVTDGSAQVSADGAAQPGPGQVDSINMEQAYSRAEQMGAQAKGKVFKTTIAPHWFADNTCFWYRNDTKNSTTEFVRVNCVKGSREAAFDHEKLAGALSKVSERPIPEQKLAV